MTNIDELLPVISQNIKQLQEAIPKKDKRILVSFAKQIDAGNFFTENQANLFVKLVKENSEIMKHVIPIDLDSVLQVNNWSKKFRILKQVRKIGMSTTNLSNFIVEFSYNSKLSDKMTQLMPKLIGTTVKMKGFQFEVLLAEQNILLVLDTFIKDKFDIDATILAFYTEIKECLKTCVSPFDVYNLEDGRLKAAIESDIGDITKAGVLLLHDRKCRYQYTVAETSSEESLTAKIAQRSSRKIFINSELTSVTELLSSLKALNRLPLLVMLDGRNPEKDAVYVKQLEAAVTALGIDNNIGIYFRYTTDVDTVHFNPLIATLEYNRPLTDQTVIAGIGTSKLPKFIIKDRWKPQSVIVFTNSFKGNKSYVYCSDVDLIVYYNITQPLDGEIHALV
jgi:hypothetical protein